MWVGGMYIYTHAVINTPPWCRVSVLLTSHTPLLPFPPAIGERFCQLPFLDPHLNFSSSSLINHTQPFEERENWVVLLWAACMLTGFEDVIVACFFFSERYSCGNILKPVNHDLLDISWCHWYTSSKITPVSMELSSASSEMVHTIAVSPPWPMPGLVEIENFNVPITMSCIYCVLSGRNRSSYIKTLD